MVGANILIDIGELVSTLRQFAAQGQEDHWWVSAVIVPSLGSRDYAVTNL
jgi:hypothetical protein